MTCFVHEMGDCCESRPEVDPDKVLAVCELFTKWIFENEFKCDSRLIWDEVIRNKTIAPAPMNPQPIEALNVDQRRNFFFREIISLKELYKDFERC